MDGVRCRRRGRLAHDRDRRAARAGESDAVPPAVPASGGRMSGPTPVRFREGLGCLGLFLSVFPAIPLAATVRMALDGNGMPLAVAAAICIPLLATFLLGRS